MFIPLNMVLIGIDPYPHGLISVLFLNNLPVTLHFAAANLAAVRTFHCQDRDTLKSYMDEGTTWDAAADLDEK